MAGQGTATVDFGAWPGSDLASAAITGQAGISAGSLVESWIFPTATANHSVDEHIIDSPVVCAGDVVAGTGFTIYAHTKHNNSLLYGQWTVAWVWN